MLINQGRNVVLLRTGHVLPTSYDGLLFRPGPRCIELGFVERAEVPAIMHLAAVAIQPGDVDAFNSFRLPAKVPEYLSLGKPLVMGATPVGLELKQAGAAHILPQMSPRAMMKAVEELLDQPGRARDLGERGRQFAHGRFSEAVVIPKLESFYQRCLTSADRSSTSGHTRWLGVGGG